MKILLAGATGYLGGFIAKELEKRNYFVRAIVRNPEKLKSAGVKVDELIKAELTVPESLENCCDGIDIVISTVGITKQRDGLTYLDVDYQANMNLLAQAKRSGVKRFIYISALNGNQLKDLKIFQAKEMFVEQLSHSTMDFCIIRPNGFFSDMSEFYHMAKQGRIYLFGNGEIKGNPIHGKDLAEVCVDAMTSSAKEINIGGPEILTQNEIATLAFNALGKKATITYLPDWIRTALRSVVRVITSSKVYGPIEFFLTVMAIDMIAPQYGKNTLKSYYKKLKDTNA